MLSLIREKEEFESLSEGEMETEKDSKRGIKELVIPGLIVA